MNNLHKMKDLKIKRHQYLNGNILQLNYFTNLIIAKINNKIKHFEV